MAEVIISQSFQRAAKPLIKKYPSYKSDLNLLIRAIQKNPKTGTSLGKDCYKVRFAISSKGKGKSGSARIVTCFKVIADTVFFLTVYDKSEQSNITDKKIKELLKESGLL